MTELTPEISTKLKAPFSNVSWRVQSKSKTDKTKGRVVAYIDARDVMDRLDETVGPGGWQFDWTPITMSNNDVITVKGTLTICGISRSDIGEAGDIEKSKAAVSDALKRAAVHFGCARYLYDLGAQYATLDGSGNIPSSELMRLNKLLDARLNKNHPQQKQQTIPTSQPQTKETKPSESTDEEFARLTYEIEKIRDDNGINAKVLANWRIAGNISANLDGLRKMRKFLDNVETIKKLVQRSQEVSAA